MKLKLKLLPAILALLAGTPVAAQADESPIVTFHTTLYENVGAANAFHFYIGSKTETYIDVDFGFGKTEVEVTPAGFDSSSSSIKATTVTGSVGADGIVKIYGDPSQIDYLDLEGVYITDLDITALTGLEILNLKHNEIKALDLSMMKSLQALYVSDNPFDSTPLIIGKDKPSLTILEMSNCGAIDQSLNISDYPNLASFDAYATKDLRKLDPTGCPHILQISIDCTSVTEIDISKNPDLLILNVSETGIYELDLSNNTYLTELYCGHSGSWMTDYKFDSLDVSMLPNLQRLFCQDNNLTQLDVTKNPLLTDLHCNGNHLTSIDISNNPRLLNLNIANNNMDFSTMPLPRDTFIEYLYYQKPMPMSRSYPVNQEFDFSSKVVIPDSETWFALFAKSEDADGNKVNVELPEDYYSFKDGKVTVLKSSPDSLFMAFANSLFPDYDLKTTCFMVKDAEDYGKDNKTISMRVRPATKKLALAVGIRNASEENPIRFTVDFGDGNPKEFTTTTSGLPAAPNASGDILKASSPMVVYIPEGEDLIAFSMESIGLVSIDLTGAPALEDLKLTGCQLSAIDLTCNIALRKADLSSNNLKDLNLNGRNDMYDKNFLTYLNASSNSLTSVGPAFPNLQYVDLSNNLLEEVNLLKASEMTYLDLSHNLLADVAIQDLESVKHLDLSHNELADIIIADYINLDYFNLSGNRFPLSTLPAAPATTEYVYAPQKEWALPEKAPTANLTAQLLDSATEFTWYKSDGSPITGDGIKQNNPGVFQLLDTGLGSVYCTFSNPTFPDFSGDNIYRTTAIEIAEMPSNVVCSLYTLADGIGELGLRAEKDNTLLYIDWEGNGALEEFMAGKQLVNYPVNVHSNAEVKVYSYSENSGMDVFSLGAGPLKNIDASPLTGLKTFSLFGSYLSADNISLPASPSLEELTISKGDITNIDIIKGKYPQLRLLNLASNKLVEGDFSEWKNLEALHIDNNNITSVKFDNPVLWELGLSQNKLSEINLSGLPSLDQLWIFDNDLHSIDFSGNPLLRVVDLSENRFDFLTLPEISDNFDRYIYKNQKPIAAEVKEGGVVDLSGLGAESYRWFIDTPYIDSTTEELTGEELIEGKEYTIDNGVTTFLKKFSNVICVMQNEAFPELYLYTDFLNIRNVSGIEDIMEDGNKETVIYDLYGRRIKNPSKGIYIINGKKAIIR